MDKATTLSIIYLSILVTFIKQNQQNIMSSELIWNVIRVNNAFLKTSNGTTFSKEPNNLMNVNSFKFSGLANQKTVGVALNGKKIVMTTRHGGPNKVSKAQKKTTLGRYANKTQKGAVAAAKLTSGSYYRGDLSKYALARYSALTKSLQLKKTVVVKAPRGKRGAKSAQ